MLEQLHIKNFTIIEELHLECAPGMTVFTGETGAGKSIIIDAINLALGDRAESTVIRPGQARAEISAVFAIAKLPFAQAWLQEHGFDTDDNSLILRRIIQREGRSQAFINGQPSTLNQLRELCDRLLTIHGQHDQQLLLARDHQRYLLDLFADNTALCAEIANLYQQWKKYNTELAALANPEHNLTTRVAFLQFQLQELEELAIAEYEVEQLHQEYKKLTNAEQILSACQQAIQICDEDENAISSQLYRLNQMLTPYTAIHPALLNAVQLLQSAQVQIDEANSEINSFLNHAELDPERLAGIEQRLKLLHDVARKHHIQAEGLFALKQKLQQELNDLAQNDEKIKVLQQAINKLVNDYKKVAAQLTERRQSFAKKFSLAVTKHLQQLGMPTAKFSIEFLALTTTDPTPFGNEAIQFLMQTNPGQTPQALSKIVSGGELSRIALAIDVITAELYATPTIIFDEIDTGIGGGTAAIVGQLLGHLSKSAQVFCITHLAQVAVNAHQHWKVSKLASAQNTTVMIDTLNKKDRIQELARMIGGVNITKQTLAHAKELLDSTAHIEA
jgi:DNA repair protein RecN (Recombination protein N)